MMRPMYFLNDPTIPDEVAQYREPVDPRELLAGITLEKLNAIYKSIIRRQEDKIDPIRSKFGTIEKEEVSLSDKMIEIRDFARNHRKFSFRNLLESQCSKVQVIVTFLSILELIKMGHIHVEQDSLFDDISVEVKDRSRYMEESYRICRRRITEFRGKFAGPAGYGETIIDRVRWN